MSGQIKKHNFPSNINIYCHFDFIVLESHHCSHESYAEKKNLDFENKMRIL